MLDEGVIAPQGWSVEPLSECVDVLDNRRKPVNSKERATRQGDVPYYGATGQVGWIDDYLFAEELVLLGEDGAPFLDKSKSIAYVIDGKSWVNNHAHVLRARAEVTSNRYIKHYLDSFDFTHRVQGSTRDKLTQRSMNTIPVLLAPRAVQDALVSTIDSVHALRTSASAHLLTARRVVERFRHTVVAAACSGGLTADWRESRSVASPGIDLVAEAKERRQAEQGARFKEPRPNEHSSLSDLPAGWSISPLGLLLTEIKYGTSVRADYSGGDTAVLRIPNVSTGRLNLSDLKYATLSRRETQALGLALHDILMIRSNGSPQLVGRSVMVRSPDAVGMAYAGYLMRLRADREAVTPRFVEAALASPDVRRQVEMPLRSTSGVNNINTDEVRRLSVPVPPLEEQAEIVRRLDHLLRVADVISERIDTATLRIERSSQAVLAKAFRGDLLPNGATSTTGVTS